MNPLHPSFLFKIDFIAAAHAAPVQTFANGFYKPPIRSNHYEDIATTGWHQWTTGGVETATAPPFGRQGYSTSLFYDGVSTSRFLFYPADCRTVNISDIEAAYHERFGWSHLRFTHRDPNHSVLDLDGEFSSLCGRPGTYSPNLLPSCYRSMDYNVPCRLSGKIGLLLALTAYSCCQQHTVRAIRYRLRLQERRWDDFPTFHWGNGRTLDLLRWYRLNH